jgi:hypothetical protein
LGATIATAMPTFTEFIIDWLISDQRIEHAQSEVTRNSNLLKGKEIMEPPAGVEPATC